MSLAVFATESQLTADLPLLQRRRRREPVLPPQLLRAQPLPQDRHRVERRLIMLSAVGKDTLDLLLARRPTLAPTPTRGIHSACKLQNRRMPHRGRDISIIFSVLLVHYKCISFVQLYPELGSDCSRVNVFIVLSASEVF